MAYLHGVRVQENPTSISSPVSNNSGVPVIFGTAPVNQVSDPSGAVNQLFLCNTYAEAKEAVGYSADYDSYTLCQAMDAFFKAFGVGPIVLCNVLDPDTHRTSFTEDVTVINGTATAATAGIIADGLSVKNGDTELTADEDYVLSFDDDGNLLVSVLTDDVTTVSLSGYALDPSAVQASDVIGGYDSETGKETGIELVRKVYPLFSLVPGLLLAPGWSQIPSVGIALGEKCQDINGLFRCECVVDIDSSADGATKYTDVENVKTASGYDSNEHMICVWPKVTYAGNIMAYSALYAAMVMNTDYENDSVPNLSPSNKNLRIGATVLEDGTEVNLDNTQANELNAIGVVTAVNHGVFKSWGNNTAAYPATTTDPKDRWIACRRFFSWWGNNFIVNYMDKVDNPANYRLIESIVDSENVRGNSLVSSGKCAGIKMVYDAADNPIENVLDGKIVFRQYLAPYAPAEDILNILEFDPSMIETALGGSES